MDFFTEPEFLPYNVAFCLMGILALSEVVSLVMGVGVSDFIEDALPDIPDLDLEVPDADLDAEVDVDHDIKTTTQAVDGDIPLPLKILAWLRMGRIPFLISLAVFLMSFSVIGYVLQSNVSVILPFIPSGLIVGVTIFLSFPVLRAGNTLIGKVWPKDETSAVSQQSLVGQVAKITLGMATQERPAEAKVRDKFDHTHYVMVRPDSDETFTSADELLLIAFDGQIYSAIKNTNTNLTY